MPYVEHLLQTGSHEEICCQNHDKNRFVGSSKPYMSLIEYDSTFEKEIDRYIYIEIMGPAGRQRNRNHRKCTIFITGVTLLFYNMCLDRGLT